MKKLTILIAVGITFLLTAETDAQYKRIGVRAGINIANQRISNQNELTRGITPNSLIGGTGGFLFQSSKNNYFVTNFGLLYSGKGTRIEDTQLNFHYIQMPLVFNFRIPIAGPVYFKAGFGPYLGFAFLGSEKYDGLKNEDIFSLKRKASGGLISVDDPSEIMPYNPIDLGVMFGGDVEINLPNNTALDVRFDYEIGIWKTSNDQLIIPEDDNSAFNYGLKNNTMRITVAYMFDITKEVTQ